MIYPLILIQGISLARSTKKTRLQRVFLVWISAVNLAFSYTETFRSI